MKLHRRLLSVCKIVYAHSDATTVLDLLGIGTCDCVNCGTIPFRILTLDRPIQRVPVLRTGRGHTYLYKCRLSWWNAGHWDTYHPPLAPSLKLIFEGVTIPVESQVREIWLPVSEILALPDAAIDQSGYYNPDFTTESVRVGEWVVRKFRRGRTTEMTEICGELFTPSRLSTKEIQWIEEKAKVINRSDSSSRTAPSVSAETYKIIVGGEWRRIRGWHYEWRDAGGTE